MKGRPPLTFETGDVMAKSDKGATHDAHGTLGDRFPKYGVQVIRGSLWFVRLESLIKTTSNVYNLR